jgi:hypothetical protein
MPRLLLLLLLHPLPEQQPWLLLCCLSFLRPVLALC